MTSPTPRRSKWQNDVDEETVRLLALVDGVPAGRGFLARGRAEATTIADVDIAVVPAFEGRGVGRALGGALLAQAADSGVRSLQAWVEHHPAPGPRLAPPTGFGDVPADTRAVRFLQRQGFELEQVERMSELRLADAAPGLRAHLAAAERHAHPRYRLEAWTGRTPRERLASLAALHARMSTDAPAAGLDHEEEVWDAARVERYETEQVDAGRTILRAVAVEAATDAVVAFTTIAASEPGRRAYQHDTLVHGDHRGHRLGTLVKVGNLLALAEHDPSAIVTTWNAEENRPMLAVNEALGFVPIAYEGAWQRRLAAVTPPS